MAAPTLRTAGHGPRVLLIQGTGVNGQARVVGPSANLEVRGGHRRAPGSLGEGCQAPAR